MKYKVVYKGKGDNTEEKVVDANNVAVGNTMTQLTSGFGNGLIVHLMVPNDRIISVEKID